MTITITTPYFTDARGQNINHSRCAHASTSSARRICRNSVKALIAKNAVSPIQTTPAEEIASDTPVHQWSDAALKLWGMDACERMSIRFKKAGI